MDPASSFDPFVPSGLAAIGIEASDDELAVMRAAHELYWPGISGLLAVDLAGVGPEPDPDMSRPPREP